MEASFGDLFTEVFTLHLLERLRLARGFLKKRVLPSVKEVKRSFKIATEDITFVTESPKAV